MKLISFEIKINIEKIKKKFIRLILCIPKFNKLPIDYLIHISQLHMKN